MSHHIHHPLEDSCIVYIEQTSTEAYAEIIELDERLQVQIAKQRLQRLHGMRMTVQGLIKQIDNLVDLCGLDNLFFDRIENGNIQEYRAILHQHKKNPNSVLQAVAIVMAIAHERMWGWYQQFTHEVWTKPPLSEHPEIITWAPCMSDLQAHVQFIKLVAEIEANKMNLPA